MAIKWLLEYDGRRLYLIRTVTGLTTRQWPIGSYGVGVLTDLVRRANRDWRREQALKERVKRGKE